MKSIYEQEELDRINREHLATEEEDKERRKYSIWKPWTWPWWVLVLWIAGCALLRFIFIVGG